MGRLKKSVKVIWNSESNNIRIIDLSNLNGPPMIYFDSGVLMHGWTESYLTNLDVSLILLGTHPRYNKSVLSGYELIGEL